MWLELESTLPGRPPANRERGAGRGWPACFSCIRRLGWEGVLGAILPQASSPPPPSSVLSPGDTQMFLASVPVRAGDGGGEPVGSAPESLLPSGLSLAWTLGGASPPGHVFALRPLDLLWRE